MKLRNQLLTLSLATLLVPWFGWKLVQELEQFLRAGQESALLASARTLAMALPDQYRAELAFGRDHVLPLRALEQAPILDGYDDDWVEPGSFTRFSSAHQALSLDLLAGQRVGQVYLFARVRETGASNSSALAPAAPGAQPDNEVLLYLRSARGLNSFRIHSTAPGPLLIESQVEGGGQLQGYWQDVPGGYDLELALPPSTRLVDLAIGAVVREQDRFGQPVTHQAGVLEAEQPRTWLSPVAPELGLAEWLRQVTPAGTRSWVLDRHGWVMAGTGTMAASPARTLTWAERTLYRVVAGGRTEFSEPRPDPVVRFQDPLVLDALEGEARQQWRQDPDSAEVRNTVAVPIAPAGQTRGAVVLEASQDGLLLVTNRALGRLLLSTLLVTVGLAAGLWFFASRLSRRVQRLSGAVSQAMDDASKPSGLPLTEDGDELGDLARNNARLLRAVADYTGYLNKLASRLSHELKTPLAITRSSLDNLDAQAMDEDSRRYLERAREGLDRQAAIVRAMSEASRLDAALRSADWEATDVSALLANVAEAYRGLHPGRDIRLELPADAVRWTCAPDLLVQALDKLVDNAISLTGYADSVTISMAANEAACRITVANTGSRLPDTLQDQLFDSLVSVRETASDAVHLGLGLHIVRLVAEAHGGSASARNLPGEAGVAFTVSLAAA